MPPTKTTKKPAAKQTAAKSSPAKAAPTSKPAAKRTAKAPAGRMTLAEAMRELEQAGSEQTRKTYRRHGVTGPQFGTSFATLKVLKKRIGVDHELALALWQTGNFDARNLAVKVVDPQRLTPAELDRWARDSASVRMCASYVGMIASEGPHAAAKLARWANAGDDGERRSFWALLAQLAARDESIADPVFLDWLTKIERSIHSAPNGDREAMNQAVIAIGTRNASLRKAALAAAKRIGKVEVDHGDTECKTPDAATYIEKAWAHAASKGFQSPAEQERARECPRTRC